MVLDIHITLFKVLVLDNLILLLATWFLILFLILFLTALQFWFVAAPWITILILAALIPIFFFFFFLVVLFILFEIRVNVCNMKSLYLFLLFLFIFC